MKTDNMTFLVCILFLTISICGCVSSSPTLATPSQDVVQTNQPAPNQKTAEVQEEDLAFLKQRAEQGDVSAQTMLGLYYVQITKDYAQAREWFEKAAYQGDCGAQWELGVLYEYGQGVPQDYVKAKEWYEKAAVQGDSTAQFLLGWLYARGLGVPQDYVKARHWVEKASVQGDVFAQVSLGALYYNGQGVRQDYWQAREWFGKACDNGYQEGCDAYRMLTQRGIR